MKRKLNESTYPFNDGIKICVSEIRNDDPSMDCNELRDIFAAEGADVDGSHGYYDGKPATFMTVYNLDEDKVIEILQNFLNDSDSVMPAEDYIQEPDKTDMPGEDFPSYDAVETDEDDIEPEEDYPAYDVKDYAVEPVNDYPEYESIDVEELDPEEDQLNDELDNLNEDVDVIEDAKAELQGLLNQLNSEDSIDFDEPVILDSIDGEIISIDGDGILITDNDDEINAMDINDSDDIYILCDAIKDELDNEAAYPDYNDVDIDDEYTPRVEKFHKAHKLEEKKKNSCCPGTKTLNENIDTVLNDIDTQALNESNKIASENKKALKKKALKAIVEKRDSLHTNIRYNGKSFAKMTLKELQSLYETIKASVDALSERTLNESVVDQKTIATINNKKQLLEYLDEEITYRTTRIDCLNKLNEDNAEISDEELKNLFGPAQGEDASSDDSFDDTNDDSSDDDSSDDENSDDNNDEEVELSRIEITLKDAEAANDLKQACLDADIPEDAFELENVDEESATEDEKNSDENSEESSDENTEENSEENSEEASESVEVDESYEYAKYVKALMEGEFINDQSSDDINDNTSDENTDNEESIDDSTENSDENNDENSEEDEDKQPKFILTNTDYAAKLAKVLEDIYGISKDEFEDMIGGKIVEDESDDENSDEDSNDENSDSKSSDSESSNDENSDEKKDDEDDEIDPSDLFKNL